MLLTFGHPISSSIKIQTTFVFVLLCRNLVQLESAFTPTVCIPEAEQGAMLQLD